MAIVSTAEMRQRLRAAAHARAREALGPDHKADIDDVMKISSDTVVCSATQTVADRAQVPTTERVAAVIADRMNDVVEKANDAHYMVDATWFSYAETEAAIKIDNGLGLEIRRVYERLAIEKKQGTFRRPSRDEFLKLDVAGKRKVLFGGNESPFEHEVDEVFLRMESSPMLFVEEVYQFDKGKADEVEAYINAQRDGFLPVHADVNVDVLVHRGEIYGFQLTISTDDHEIIETFDAAGESLARADW